MRYSTRRHKATKDHKDLINSLLNLVILCVFVSLGQKTTF